MTPVVILAAGEGRRLGGNKPLHAYDGAPLIGHVIARMQPQTKKLAINARPDMAEGLTAFGLPLIFDEPDYAGLGPLSGIRTALLWAQKQGFATVITVPCDMPNLPADLVVQLNAASDAEVVHFSGQHDYPLCALWHTHLLPRLEQALAEASGGLAVWRFLQQVQVRKQLTDDDDAFVNINRP